MNNVLLLPRDANVLDGEECLNALEFNVLAVTTNTQGRDGGLEAQLPMQLKADLARHKDQGLFTEAVDREGVAHQLCVLPNHLQGEDFYYDYVIAVVDNARHPVGSVIAATITQVVHLAETLRQGTPVLTLPIPRTGDYLRLTAKDMAEVARTICTHPEVETGSVTLQLACRNPELRTALETALRVYR